MNLDAGKMLSSAAVGLIDSSALGPLEGYAGASAGGLGMALMILSDQLDSAVATLSSENDALREIFGSAATRVGGELGERLSATGQGQGDDLRVHVLQAENDALRALLIELHAWVEEAGADAADLDDTIWAELSASTERRKVGFAPF
jgi:hypothetical protein